MAGVTVLAPTAVEADALSTALFVLGPEAGAALIRRLPGRAMWRLTRTLSSIRSTACARRSRPCSSSAAAPAWAASAARTPAGASETRPRWLRTASAAAWEEALNDASIPAARVRTVGEFSRTALATMPGAIVDVPAMPGHPEGARTLGVGYHTDTDPAALASGAARLGEHTVEVLTGIGYEADAIRAMLEADVIAQAKAPVAAA